MNFTRGTNQSSLRQYNERLVLSLVRSHGSLPRADIARLTGLSPPTISTIIRLLKEDGLVLEEEPQRGRIGQPSVPVSLHPEGAFAFGVKVGRRSADIILVDFLGVIQADLHIAYSHPVPDDLLGFIRDGIARLSESLPETGRDRIAGVGIAMPFEIWNWETELDAPAGAMQVWESFDLRAAVDEAVAYPVFISNDATAACAAEHLLGLGPFDADILHVFIAWFIGGGVLIDGRVFEGQDGYAGSLGQVLVPASGADGKPEARQLLQCASIHVLEKMMRAAGRDPSPIWESPDDWQPLEPVLTDWIELVASSLASAIISAVAVIGFPRTIIDGVMPLDVRKLIVSRTRVHIEQRELRGLPPFEVLEGTIGARGPAKGAACLPYLREFAGDRDPRQQKASQASN